MGLGIPGNLVYMSFIKLVLQPLHRSSGSVAVEVPLFLVIKLTTTPIAKWRQARILVSQRVSFMPAYDAEEFDNKLNKEIPVLLLQPCFGFLAQASRTSISKL